MRSSRAVYAVLLAIATSMGAIPSPVDAAKTHRSVVNVSVVLPARVGSVDYVLRMQRRASSGQWVDVSKVSPCYDPTRAECQESRIADPGTIVPAVPGLRTKDGAYYRFIFNDLPAGTYRFVGSGYYSVDGVQHIVPFQTRAYRTT